MIAEFFGFATIESTLWNLAAYVALAAIIIGVFHNRLRNFLFLFGAGMLAAYASLFLDNKIFAILQVLVMASAILQIKSVSKRRAIVIMSVLAAVVYLFLLWSDAIENTWALIGSIGLLGLAFGLMTLPKRSGFILMATAGILLALYAFEANARVFFLLNIFFTAANLYSWKRQETVPT